ncbi:MAG: ribosome small subunit-dependent GTPase A [Acidobacteria bacterium]|nr:ribosome small subunit-dependent GTPase A [Acidobacteriota bacterium]
MSISDLGFDDWFENQINDSESGNFELARVTAVHKDSCVITNGNWQTRAEVTGKLLFSAESSLDLPTVGDWVFVQYFGEDSSAIIHEILPRRSILKRKTAGRKVEFQAIASNIDIAFVVQSLDSDLSIRRLERYLVMIREGNIEPVILLSKKDLLSDPEVIEKLEEIRNAFPELEVIAFSNDQNDGIDRIREFLAVGKTLCLVGSSGVGKTTLLNKLIGEELFATKEVREKDSKGKHTTTNRQLIILKNGGMIIDTPGMRELGNIGVESGIDSVFDEITDLESCCKYNDCSHSNENGCAILEALDEGVISEERFSSYKKMKAESAHNEMSYQEKKMRSKKLGKLYKSIQSGNRKNIR